jgi:hypothetical protein
MAFNNAGVTRPNLAQIQKLKRSADYIARRSRYHRRDYPQITQIFRVGFGPGSAQDYSLGCQAQVTARNI